MPHATAAPALHRLPAAFDPGAPTVRRIMALSWDRTIEWGESAWRDHAACRDSAPDLFFPIGATGLALEQIDAAKAICDRCVVRLDCLEFALETNQEAGVWGGTSEDERRAIRRGWVADRPAHATV